MLNKLFSSGERLLASVLPARLVTYPVTALLTIFSKEWWTPLHNNQIYIGKVPLLHHVSILKDLGVTDIISLTEEY